MDIKSITKRVSEFVPAVMCRRPHTSVSASSSLHDTDNFSEFAADRFPGIFPRRPLSEAELFEFMISQSDASRTPAMVDGQLGAIRETQSEEQRLLKEILVWVSSGSSLV